jgi:hypothetical protein
MRQSLTSAALILLFCLYFGAAVGQSLNSHGWSGSIDVDGTTFLGCHLDSPQSLSQQPDQIRIAAPNQLRMSFQFLSIASNANLAPGTKSGVKLALGNVPAPFQDEQALDDYYLMTNQKPGTPPQLHVAIDDPLIQNLGRYRYLKIYFPISAPFILPQSAVIDLKHKDATSDAGAANDTAGAIASVIDCVSKQTSEISLPGSRFGVKLDAANLREMRKKTGFRLSLEALLASLHGKKVEEWQEFYDAGAFYCDAKQFIPYDNANTYPVNVSNASQRAAGRLSELGFWLGGRSADDVLLSNMAMILADKRLCPGWPTHSPTK